MGTTAYNFEYIIRPVEKSDKTIDWLDFYMAVPNWDADKLHRPADWLNIKMAEKLYVTYRPIQPFDLTVDPVSKFVTFTDYEPADKRPKFKQLRTLREISPGSWPASPTPDETLIATQLDVAAIARAAEEVARIQDDLNKTLPLTSSPDDKTTGDLTTSKTTTTEPTPVDVTPNMALIETAIREQVKSTLEELISKTPAKLGSQTTESEEKRKMEIELAKMRRDIRTDVIRELEYKNPTNYNNNNKRDYYDRRRERSRERRRSKSPMRRPRSRSREKKKKSPEPETKVVELLRVGLEQLAQGQSSTRQEQQLQKRVEQQQQQMALMQRQQTQLESQLRQQQGTSYPAHSTFHLPGPEPAMFLPYPGSRPPLTKRASLENQREQHYPTSPDTTPDRTRKVSGGTSAEQQLWLQFQRQYGERRDDDIGGFRGLPKY